MRRRLAAEEATTAVTRSAHDISQLVIRIRWRSRFQPSDVEEADGGGPSQVQLPAAETADASKEAESSQQWHEELFRWQQKKGFELPSGDAAGKLVLFTYVDADYYTDSSDLYLRSLTDSERERPTRVARAVLDHRAKHLVLTREAEDSDHDHSFEPEVGRDPDDGFLSNFHRDDTKPPRHIQDSSEQVMHIMAGASDRDTMTWQEFTLCSLKARDDGTLAARPPLGRPVPPVKSGKSQRNQLRAAQQEEPESYTLSLPDGSTFDFIIENAAEIVGSDGGAPPPTITGEDTSSKRKAALAFELPGTDNPIVRMAGEIVSASGFEEAEDMFVQWWADPLRGGEFITHREHTNFHVEASASSAAPTPTLDDEALHGVTQMAQARSRSWFEVGPPERHFGFPFGFDLERTQEGNSDAAAGIPMYFELASTDSKDRFRTEGYGAITIPVLSTPGMTELKIGVWRPKDTIRSGLRRFFIGGTPAIKDIEYLGDRKSRAAPVQDLPIGAGDPDRLNTYSRYGFETETVGELKIRFQVIVQDSDFGRSQDEGAEVAARERSAMEALGRRRRGNVAMAPLKTTAGATRHPATIAAIVRAKMRVEQIRKDRAAEKKDD